jgi:hypothetical protein
MAGVYWSLFFTGRLEVDAYIILKVEWAPWTEHCIVILLLSSWCTPCQLRAKAASLALLDLCRFHLHWTSDLPPAKPGYARLVPNLYFSSLLSDHALSRTSFLVSFYKDDMSPFLLRSSNILRCMLRREFCGWLMVDRGVRYKHCASRARARTSFAFTILCTRFEWFWPNFWK